MCVVLPQLVLVGSTAGSPMSQTSTQSPTEAVAAAPNRYSASGPALEPARSDAEQLALHRALLEEDPAYRDDCAAVDAEQLASLDLDLRTALRPRLSAAERARVPRDSHQRVASHFRARAYPLNRYVARVPRDSHQRVASYFRAPTYRNVARVGGS